MTHQNFIFISILSFILSFSGSLQASEWSQEIELYGMGSSIEGDASIGRATGADVEVGFDDILEVLNAATMLHYELYQESGWGLVLDYGFMDLRDEVHGSRGGVAKAKVRQGVFQADVIYRLPRAGGSLDLLAGVRWWDNDLEVTVDTALLPGSVKSEVHEDWVDIFVGARWSKSINSEWSYMLRGDVGGFGFEADFTSSVSAGLKYAMTDEWVLDMQYKATWVDYESGTKGQRGYFSYDTVTHGPVIGLIYKF